MTAGDSVLDRPAPLFGGEDAVYANSVGSIVALDLAMREK
jgi:hypothetical protein